MAASKASSKKQKSIDGKSIQTNIVVFVSISSPKVPTTLHVEPGLRQRSNVGLNNAIMDMASADLCYGNNIPFMCF